MAENDKKQHYSGHRHRLRSRVLEDPHKAPAYEILELLLGYVHIRRDTKPLAKNLLEQFGSLAGLLDAHPTQRQAMEGVGEGVEALFVLLRETITRYVEENVKSKKSISLADIGELARCRLAGNPREEVWAALLDNGHRLLTFTRVNTGSVNNVLVSPLDVVELTLKHKATGLVLVHNHPGGSTLPSTLDLETTRRLVDAMTAVGLRFLDHLILADGKYHSLAKDHLLA